ncbi:lysophospholipid acyltransferase 1 [Clupea harengus]|uniref:Lysophospholipid acyltransferase 1 n=1 Tax=Clupea harengus TaxID=7950 RepID=A0A6P3W5K2_CLUHA|nr:lysophospholipid acyltransferase 1 [Clupea harengus]
MGEESVTHRTTGSVLLSPVSDIVGVPLDQVNFLVCQIFGLALAFWFRLSLSHRRVGPVVRHAVATLLGSCFAIFCFGWYASHLFILVLACYAIMVMASQHNIQRYSMITAMGYLTVCQVSRVFIFNYGILSTDFSGPLMIVTQKITILAFQVHDGMCKEETLTPEQKDQAVVSKPSLLQYLSYNLNFFSVLVGPCSNYKDYEAFIEGRHLQHRLRRPGAQGTSVQNGWDKMPSPSPVGAVGHKLLICAGCLVVFFSVTKAFPIAYNIDPHFISETPFPTRLAYAFVSIQAARPKFYFAWTLADAVHNAAGYGIKGLNEKGEVSWDLISNIHIWEIETATSFKKFIDNWNIQTGIWLKFVCYDRASRYRTALTFVLSALWHGVYPGYYFTFLTAIPITMAARAMRKNARHHFLSCSVLKLSYDGVTWAATQLTICYTVMPFLLLAVEPTMQYYRSMYFHVHIISVLLALSLPGRPRGPRIPPHNLNNNVKED